MKITREHQDTTAERWAGWHILTVAEAGFSMLDIYARFQHGLDIEVIRQFADRINDHDETGSLHPRAPISAVPRRFFRGQENLDDASVVNVLTRYITEFLVANRDTIHAQKILIDFHVSPASVSLRYLDVAEEVVRLHGQGSIQEVVLFT
jgi:hypothetical protein